MPGIDITRVVGKNAEELEEFVCGICHDMFVEPLTTPCCRQSFCKECIEEWVTPHKSCPMGCVDRKPLTRGRLIKAARCLTNFIDRVRIKCKLSADGCPVVHTIGKEADHLIVCEFVKCKDCGLKGSLVDHNCVEYLKERFRNLNEDNDKLKAENGELKKVVNDLRSIEKVVKVEDKDSKTLLGPHKRANEANQSEVVVKAKKWEELKNEVKHYKSMIIPLAIMEAKGESGTVEENRNIGKGWENVMIDICSKAIDQFDNTLHSDDHLVEMIETQLDKKTKRFSCYLWSVAIFVNQVFYDWSTVPGLVRLSFGKLIIIVYRE